MIGPDRRKGLVDAGWQPLNPSRPGADDSMIQLDVPRLVQFRRADGSMSTPMRLGVGVTTIYGWVAFRIVGGIVEL